MSNAPLHTISSASMKWSVQFCSSSGNPVKEMLIVQMPIILIQYTVHFKNKQCTCEIHIARRAQHHLCLVNNAASIVQLESRRFFWPYNAFLWLAVGQPKARHPHVFNRIVYRARERPIPDARLPAPLQPRVVPLQQNHYLQENRPFTSSTVISKKTTTRAIEKCVP